MDQRLPDDNGREPVENVGRLGNISAIDRWRALVGLVVGPLLLVILRLTPFPGLTTEAHWLTALDVDQQHGHRGDALSGGAGCCPLHS